MQKRVSDLLHTEIITRGDLALTQEPVTITSFVAERSAGGVHDFYSEGDYWWPDPVNPDSAYIRRDGETNPDNFVAHRHAMIRFSSIVGDLTSAWIVTKDEKYICGTIFIGLPEMNAARIEVYDLLTRIQAEE